VRVLHGYTRERRGEIEINVGNRGQLYLEPMDAVEEDFPQADSFYKTPGEIHSPGTVNLVGVVVDKFPVSTFERQDGSKGKVARLVLEEGGGRTYLVLWDDKADEASDTAVGTRLRVTGGNARRRDNGNIEVHTNYGTIIDILEVGVQPEEPVAHWTGPSGSASGTTTSI